MEKKDINNFVIPLLPCRSIKETLEFYQAIGSQITYKQKAPNNYIGLKIAGVEIHFFGMKQIKPNANFSSCYLVMNDIDVYYNLCKEGLKELFGKIPIKGIPRINQLKDMPIFGVRQFIIVDPSGNYLRIGQPIPKIDSVLFEENGKKPQRGSTLIKAYELAARLAHGKDDLVAAITVIDKVLAEETGLNEMTALFKIITLRIEIAHQMDDTATIEQLIKRGDEALNQIDNNNLLKSDIANFRRLSSDRKTTNR
ncbi:hypothetical protein [Hymenobacter sp.]|uniref:hypothetical protein n=1 Tax=Hymenobacter sp. TaxID=1898978 RepID=UPI00286D20E6|nr:hypothetical protein [Hymenobacter sp.]